MESFFLSETLKYLYLLFDSDNAVHQRPFVFSTEAHLFEINPDFIINAEQLPRSGTA